ncbi:hypothetical protein [Streptomyces sp. NPDC004528]|uniref:hypothetical protein n=1 Tax=Streptomyces sp. NPDC004528 TaxID=3154550 RepID=UPI0033A3F89F
MTQHTAYSAHGTGATVQVDRIGQWVHVTNGDSGAARRTSVALDPSNARDIARTLLTLADEIDGRGTDSAEVKVGDRVEITKFREFDHDYVGRFGTVTDIDTDAIPYRIALDNGGFVWAVEVRKVTPDAPTRRTVLLSEARRAAGPGATPADVLAYAKFLSE